MPQNVVQYLNIFNNKNKNSIKTPEFTHEIFCI